MNVKQQGLLLKKLQKLVPCEFNHGQVEDVSKCTSCGYYGPAFAPILQEDTEEGGVRLRGITETLIWMTMMVGINEISEKTATEFFARASLEEALWGAMRSKGDESVYVSIEDVRRHIGLKTNASPYTKTQWLCKVYRQWNARVDRQLRDEQAS